MGKCIGIDLGTGFSCVSIMEGNRPKVIFNSEGKSTTPSVVSFVNGEIKIGDSAKRQAVMFPKDTVSFIKRFMGEKYDDVLDEIDRVQYKVVKGKNGMACVEVNGKIYTPQEISAMILQKMKKTAEDYLGEEVTDAVITCPAFYDDQRRRCVTDSGKIAGLNVLRVINEPTAAALSMNQKIDENKDLKIIVADIGCGTTDFTILDVASGVYEVKATNGDLHLGGQDFDAVIVNWIVDEFKKDNDGYDLTKDSMAMQRMYESAEKAKIELSSTTSTEINLPYLTSINNQPVHFIKSITRSKFEQMSDSLINRVISTCKDCMNKAKLNVSDIDEVILVGGSVRIPAIQNVIEKYFGKTANRSANPDEAISVGACLQGAIISGDKSVSDILLLDVLPISIGLETMGGVFTKMIDANTTIPISKTETFSTVMDNQPTIQVVVLQGERPMAKDNKRLGVFNFDGIMPARKGVPQIEICFDVDANGILNVSAKDKATGKAQSIRIEGSSGLSDAEIERMKKDAEANADADKKEFEKVQTLNAADSTIFQTQKQIDEYGDKLTDEQKSNLENGLNALKDAYEQKDVEACKSCMEILGKTWNDIAEVLYKDSGNGGGNPLDDVLNNMGQ